MFFTGPLQRLALWAGLFGIGALLLIALVFKGYRKGKLDALAEQISRTLEAENARKKLNAEFDDLPDTELDRMWKQAGGGGLRRMGEDTSAKR